VARVSILSGSGKLASALDHALALQLFGRELPWISDSEISMLLFSCVSRDLLFRCS
jgi:hypothetical protein